MKSGSSLDWPAIRSRAAQFPEEAFDFVRDGLRFTVETLHGPAEGGETEAAAAGGVVDERRHVSGQQLCLGLRTYAVERYGLLAGTVLGRWGLKRTDDFGTIVYAMIDRGDLRASERDSIEDFKGVFDFAEAFGALQVA